MTIRLTFKLEDTHFRFEPVTKLNHQSFRGLSTDTRYPGQLRKIARRHTGGQLLRGQTRKQRKRHSRTHATDF